MTQLYRIKASVTDEALSKESVPKRLRYDILKKEHNNFYRCSEYGKPYHAWRIRDEWMEEVKQEPGTGGETLGPEPVTPASLDEQKEAMRREIYIRLICAEIGEGGEPDHEYCTVSADRAVKAYYGEG
jgi:hypothetical protein